MTFSLPLGGGWSERSEDRVGTATPGSTDRTRVTAPLTPSLD